MALHEAHEPTTAPCIVHDGRCVVHGIAAADELQLLHKQIAQLERALEIVSKPAAQVIPLVRHESAPAVTETASEATMMPPRITPPTVGAPAEDENANDEESAFAAAWADDNSSFEERFAARQFFYDDGPESPSRKWLLG